MPEPHEGVLARLVASPIHGVGVVAIRPIASGCDIFPNDPAPIRWVDAGVVEALPEGSPERVLYHDFGIRRGNRFGCPEHFDRLTIGWFLNEPGPGTIANVAATGDYRMVAARDIAAGEELTVLYATFSEAGARGD